MTETLGLVAEAASPAPPVAELVVDIYVRGEPQPKGSVQAFVDKGGHAQVRPDNPRSLRFWSDRIATEAQRAMAGRPLLRGPIKIVYRFVLPRPRSHYGVRGLLPSAPAHPAVTPDADKLERALWDALTSVVWADDRQVVEWHGVKSYGEEPGLRARVTTL